MVDGERGEKKDEEVKLKHKEVKLLHGVKLEVLFHR